MKPTIVIISLIFLLNSCDTYKSDLHDKTIIAGQIIGDKDLSDVSLINYMPEFIGTSKATPDSKGYFHSEFEIPYNLEFIFGYEGTFKNFVINPGDSIYITYDLASDSIVEYSGDNGKYLNSLNLFDIKETSYSELVKMFEEFKPVQYLKYRHSLYDENMSQVESYFEHNSPSKRIKSYYESKLRVKYAADLMYFLDMSAYYQDVDYSKNLSPEYISALDSLYKKSLNDICIHDYLNIPYKDGRQVKLQ